MKVQGVDKRYVSTFWSILMAFSRSLGVQSRTTGNLTDYLFHMS